MRPNEYLGNLAIIPARSGSKGLKDKNIKLLDGKPLIAYSIAAAKQSALFSEIMVSTDSDSYAAVAKQWGAGVPFLRSEETSNDISSTWDVVLEVLNDYLAIGKKFKTVCVLQPTSPLRSAADIVGGYDEFINKDADAITAVCEVDHPVAWMMQLDENLSLEEFRKRQKDAPRQMQKTFYRINGALYIKKIEYDHGYIKLLDKKEYAYIMDRKSSIDIDTTDDFDYASFLMKKFCNLAI